MNKVFTLACALLVAHGVNAEIITKYDQYEGASVRTPVITDTTDIKGEKYSDALLLTSDISIDNPAIKFVPVLTDTAGYLLLAPPEEGMKMYVLRTSIRPERYATGTVKVKSNALYEVLVDGVSRLQNEYPDSCAETASPRSVALDMDPQTAHELIIKVIAKTDTARLMAEYVADADFEDVAVTVSPDALRRFEMRDIALGPRVSGVSISPDGRYMITRYGERYSRDNSRHWATLTDLKTGRVLSDAVPTQWRWMPKGARMYYTVKSAYGYDVYCVDPATMRESRLLASVPERDFSWSPDETFLIYYKNVEAERPGSPLRRYTSPDDRIPGNRDRRVPYIYYITTGISSPLTFGNRHTAVADISADDSKALLTVSDYDPTDWPFYFTSLYQVDLTTMAVDTLVQHDATLSDATYSPDGKSAFIVSGGRSFGGIALNIGDQPDANDSDMQGFIMDIATREVRALTEHFNPSISRSVRWVAATNTIYFLAENGFDISLYALNPVSGKIMQMPQGVTYIQDYSIGNDEGRWLAYTGESYNSSGQAYLVDLKSGKESLIADPWDAVASKILWGETRRWCFNAKDGTEIEGFITTPPGFDPEKKYPAIVYYYGGTSPTLHSTYSPYNAQLFASRGYVVYQINPSGTTGYGQEFAARHANAWGDYTISDIIEGVTRLTEEHPWIDAERIGCIGCSYGGFITEYLITQTDLFAAAVSHAGISDVTSYWGQGYWGYSYNALAAPKSYPWNNSDLFTKHGALFNADKIHTPLLLTHGTADNNVPMGESVQLFNALKILGREVEMVTVDDDDHYISDYNKRIEWQNSIMAWFAKWLQDDPRWWDSLYR